MLGQLLPVQVYTSPDRIMYPGNSDVESKPPLERWGASLVVKKRQCHMYVQLNDRSAVGISNCSTSIRTT
jgi:hypothetical protein